MIVETWLKCLLIEKFNDEHILNCGYSLILISVMKVSRVHFMLIWRIFNILNKTNVNF